MTIYQYLQGKTQVKPQFTTGKTTQIVRLLFLSLSLFIYFTKQSMEQLLNGKELFWLMFR